MCMALYIGADNELLLIEWREDETPICVRNLSDADTEDRFALEHLTRRNKYYIGSWQGCGCGFTFDYTDELFEEDENNRSKQSVESLFAYIRENITSDECELFSFYMGGQYKGIQHHLCINMKDYVIGERFEFLDGQYTVVQV